MWEKTKAIYAGGYLAILAGWVLAHVILLYNPAGYMIIYEPNKGVLIIEMIALGLIILLGMERLIKAIGREK